MEQIITFVLGITAGGLIITLISFLATVLKIKKEVATLHKNADELSKRIDDVQTEVSRVEETAYKRIREDFRDLSCRIEEIDREILAHVNKRDQDDYNNLRALIEENSRYTDSRVDKTIDTLCLRMDTMFVQQKNDTTILKS